MKTITPAQLRAQIQQANQPDAPSFLPVDNKGFIQCSKAIAELIIDKHHEYHGIPSARLSLPSTVLPPPL